MTLLDRVLCLLGCHVYDVGDVIARKIRAARMGLDTSRGLPTRCDRCGRGFWR